MIKIWEFLNSLKLTVYLVLAITAVTIYGSLVLYVHPDIYGEMDNNLFFHWLFSFGLKNFGSAWWLFLLVALTVLFGVNTLVCTIDRLPKLFERYRNPLMNLRDIEVGGEKGVEVAGGRAALESALGRNGYAVFSDGPKLYAEKNRWLPFIPYVVHLGVMLFLIGHLISGTFGYRHPGLFIYEGETAPSPAGGYQLRLDKVIVDQWPDGNLKDYGSLLTVIKDGNEIMSGKTTANTPMFVEGSAVYQRAYGQDFRGFIANLVVKSTGFKDSILLPKGADHVDLPGSPYRISIDRFIPDFALDERGEPYSRSENMINPTIMITLYKDKKPKSSGWIFLREPQRDNFKDDDVSISLVDADIRPYSSFDVNRDPSAILALIAAALVMFGTFITLYFRRERVWATLDESGGRAQVVCTDDEMYERLK